MERARVHVRGRACVGICAVRGGRKKAGERWAGSANLNTFSNAAKKGRVGAIEMLMYAEL